ncbi:hypothetical protein [Burkholderia plantarii]|uniref:hypothetical protein n=1 Tax=Burkholderia plantarii TaxID=41899 RepID=UPI0018DC61B8|nr:hypothetical protein [Burkholderia plantarii]MBI0328665.1 hypothetical protein [Burkholderia plantarii]
MANTFTENWDAKRGDIIYGVDEDRTKYRGRMPASSNGSWFLMDQFNNNLLPGAKQFGKTGYPKNPDIATVAQGKVASSKNPAAADYLKYQKAAAHGALDLSQLDKRYDGKEPANADPRYSLMIRRACKHGIEFVLREEARSHLHFVLDSLASDNFQKVQLKVIEYGYTSYTYSELRYVYRNWDKFSATGRIHFYQNYEEVPAPWTVNAWHLQNQANPAKRTAT